MGQLSVSETVNLIPHGYYRSKLFITPFASNPLVSAAGPILSLLERLYTSAALPWLESLRENIQHELHAFLSRIHTNPYPEEIYVGAYYMLCATIDELLGKAYGHNTAFCAFTPSSIHDEPGPEQRFFLIMHHIKERPNQYLDLIELAYYCLTTGFEGKYHTENGGRMILDNLIEELYQLIKTHRSHKTYRLFKEIAVIRTSPKNHRPLINLGIISISVLAISILINHWSLANKINILQVGHQIFDTKIIN